MVLIYFPYQKEIIELIKANTQARWSQTKRCWMIWEKDFNLENFVSLFANKYPINQTEFRLEPEINLPFGYLEKLQQKQYSENTIRTYCHYFKDFIKAFHNQELDTIGKEEINAYILKLIKEKNISRSQQNQRINAIKFYYEKVLNQSKSYFEIDRPRKERKLPDVLSKEEIGAMLKATPNLKHKCLIALIYSCGLRRSEAINMKLEDIDSKRMLIKIRGAKGNKDRYVQLSGHLLKILRDYYKEYKPANYLFDGQNGQPTYSGESIVQVIKQSSQRAGIKKRVYPHILRHSFATHHLEQGTDLRYIQELLGHESSKTTEIYTHIAQNAISKLKNPMDEMFD